MTTNKRFMEISTFGFKLNPVSGIISAIILYILAMIIGMNAYLALIASCIMIFYIGCLIFFYLRNPGPTILEKTDKTKSSERKVFGFSLNPAFGFLIGIVMILLFQGGIAQSIGSILTLGSIIALADHYNRTA